MSSFRAQSLWSMMPILITSVVSVASVPLYFHVLGDQMYAMWFYVSTLSGTFGFMDLGLGVAVGRYIAVALGAQDEIAVREYWATGNMLVAPLVGFFAMIFIIVGLTWGPDWFHVRGQEAITMRWAILAAGIGLFFAYYGQLWHTLAQAHLDFRFLSLLRSATSLISVFGSILVALIFKNVAAILFFTTLVGIVQFTILWFRGNRKYRLPLQARLFRRIRLQEMLPYTLKTFAQLLSGSLLGSLDRLILGRLAPPDIFAAYNVALNFGSRINGLSAAVMGPIFMNTSRGVGGDEQRSPAVIYKEAFEFMVGWLGLAAIWIAIWQQPLLELWLGKDRGSLVAQGFGWIVAALCLAGVGNISSAQLASFNRVGTTLIFSTVMNAASAVFVFVGWKYSGLPGAALGYFLSRLFIILQDALLRIHAQIPFGKLEVSTFLVLGGEAIIFFAAREILDRLNYEFRFVAVVAIILGILATIPFFLAWRVNAAKIYRSGKP